MPIEDQENIEQALINKPSMINNTGEELQQRLDISSAHIQELIEKSLADAEKDVPTAHTVILGTVTKEGFRLGTYYKIPVGDKKLWSFGGHIFGDFKGHTGFEVETRLVFG